MVLPASLVVKPLHQSLGGSAALRVHKTKGVTCNAIALPNVTKDKCEYSLCGAGGFHVS